MSISNNKHNLETFIKKYIFDSQKYLLILHTNIVDNR